MEDSTLTVDVDDADQSRSRRGLLKLAGAAAAGAGVAIVAGNASPARAADDDTVSSGDVNQATRSTEFIYGTDANGTDSASTTEIVNVDATAAPDARDALHASAGTTANAVVAAADEGAAVVADATAGIGVVASGAVAAVQLVATAGVATPLERTTPAEVGSIVLDENADLWLCVEAGTPGTWRKLSGLATSGAFHPITPIRVYDSRFATYSPGGGTKMAPNTDRVISVRDSHAHGDGSLLEAGVIPVGATAVALNVTAAETTGPNFLSVVPGDTPDFNTSSLNWPGGFDIANSSIVGISPEGNVRVFCGNQTGSAHVILDVTGYYL